MKKFVVFLALFLVPMASSAHFFRDVWESSEFHTATDYLKSREIIGGYSDGTFGTNNEIKRVEVLKILIEAAKKPIPSVSRTDRLGFSDIKAGEWYVKYVKAAKTAGIAQGYNDGTFKPTATVKLSEALKMIFETYGETTATNYFDEDMTLPVDVRTSDWFAAYVRKALLLGIIDKDAKNKVHPNTALNRGKFANLIYTFLITRERREDEIADLPNVVMQNVAFHPDRLVIRKGTKMKFVQEDGLPHKIITTGTTPMSAYPALNSPRLNSPGEIFEVTFTETGLYPYACSLHADMKGIIEVRD